MEILSFKSWKILSKFEYKYDLRTHNYFTQIKKHFCNLKASYLRVLIKNTFSAPRYLNAVYFVKIYYYTLINWIFKH